MGNGTADVFNLYDPNLISYNGLLGNGISLGSITAINADTGVNHYVDISLNSNGLAYINSNLGKSITFAGSGNLESAQFFGYLFTQGKPAVLSLTSVNPVSEPETYALLLAGLGLISAAVKRRKAKQT